ncbi:MAG TPA: hypothetical protein VHH36_04620, partial [Candidatus Thermoplasmatota archaeon]|nr:hypothetical protein [Candidatus Thermoplasmatota archaeon]
RLGLCPSLVGVALDSNTLDREGFELSFDLEDHLDVVYGKSRGVGASVQLVEPTGLVKALKEVDASIGVESAGLHTLGAPYHDQGLGASAIASRATVGLHGEIDRISVSGQGTAGRPVYVDPATEELKAAGLNEMFVVVEAGRSVEIGGAARPVHVPADVRVFGREYTLAEIVGSVGVDLDLRANGELGARWDPATWTPRVGALGAGVGADVSAHASGRVSIFDNAITVADAAFTASASAGLRGEALLATALSPGETFTSPYTDVRFRDLSGLVVVLKADPLDVCPCRGSVGAKFLFVRTTAFFEVPQLHLPGGAVAIGSLKASSPDFPVVVVGGASSLSASSAPAPAGAAAFSASTHTGGFAEGPFGEHDLAIEVQAEPGSAGSVTLEAPVAYFDANGDAWVEPWSVTVPGVSAGPDGSATLRLDTLAVQEAVQALAPALGFGAAVQAVNDALDANGDGLPDLVHGAPFDAREPVRVSLSFEADGAAPRHAHVGEPLRLVAEVATLDGAPVQAGLVSFHLGGAWLGDAPVADGLAELSAAVPVGTPVGPGLLRAQHHATPALRAGSDHARVLLADRAPALGVDAPTAGQIVSAAQALTVRFGAPDAADLDPTSGEVQVDGGAWTPAAWLGGGVFEVALAPPFAEGAHNLRVRARDAAGHLGEAGTAFIADLGPASVELTQAPVVMRAGDDLVVSWEASEPVGGLLSLYSATGTLVASVDSGGFLAQGSLTLPGVAQGAYRYTAEFADPAGHVVYATLSGSQDSADGASVPLVARPG